MFQNSYDKKIQFGIAPTDNNTGRRWACDIIRPENAQQAIALWHIDILSRVEQSKVILKRTPPAQFFPCRYALLNKTRMKVDFFRCEIVERNDDDEENHWEQQESFTCASDNTVIPRKNSQFVEVSDQVPPRSDVARDEDPKS